MKPTSYSIILSTLVAVLIGLGACVPAGKTPPAILPSQPADAETTIEAEPALADGEAATWPASTETIAERMADAVMWNPETEPLSLLPLAKNLERPVFLTHAGDGSGRLFVVEQPGRIRIWNQGKLAESPFLDITDRVNDGANEQGLLGLAFSPDYSQSGRFYVNYTDRAGDTVVASYQATEADPDLADSATESVILAIEQPASNHNGGMLAFGPDGYLYIGTGDGGAANDRFGNGQNPETLLGKMLRLDVSSPDDQPYAIPADNPWDDADWQGVDVRDEIWAVGLRNPWRFSFDRQTSDLWIGDVGQNQFEEVNHVPAGQQSAPNFGWPIMEGTHCFVANDCDRNGLWQPVSEYNHKDGCSVTGGYVYRGEAFPQLNGVYFYADYCSGKIWGVMPDGDGSLDTVEVLDTDLSISSFGEDEKGELYITDLQGGSVTRLVITQE